MQKELAKEYGVSIDTIANIIYCKHWSTKDLTPIIKSKKIAENRNRINKKIGLEIYNKYKNSNLKRRELANNYGVSRRTIGRIVNCKHWTTEHLSDD